MPHKKLITSKVLSIFANNEIHNHTLEKAHCAKYHHVHIDSIFTLNTHADAIMNKASSTHAFFLRNIARYSKTFKLAAYSTCIRLHVEHASPVWDQHIMLHISNNVMNEHRDTHMFALVIIYFTNIFDDSHIFLFRCSHRHLVISWTIIEKMTNRNSFNISNVFLSCELKTGSYHKTLQNNGRH